MRELPCPCCRDEKTPGYHRFKGRPKPVACISCGGTGRVMLKDPPSAGPYVPMALPSP